MSIMDKHNLELLKNKVISMAGLQSITPADCKLISYLINNKTRQCISETTLKRIYGFALSNFQPSLFTLDALAKFCGYAGCKDFCEKNEKKVEQKNHEGELTWSTLKQNAAKITNFTLQALKNRSGIPYNQTINRAFIDQHMNEFLHSDCTGTVISGPAGYGKTIAICHWVDVRMKDETSNDIILFFSSTALMSVLFCGMDINSWLQVLLGYSAMYKLGNLADSNDGRFYLIVDGFDENRIKTDQFDLILNQLIDFFSIYQLQDKFKLILTMRSATWANNRHQMENGSHIWHTGFEPNGDCINVPLFSISEIKELTAKINPSSSSKNIPVEVSESFKNPLYFQLYYKQFKSNFSFHQFDRTSEFEINALFILNKVYLGKYSAEKIMLIKKLVESIDYGKQNYKVNKFEIYDLIGRYEVAYKELLSAGILRELNENTDYQYKTYIKFVNDYYLTYSIAKNLLYDSSDRFFPKLIMMLNTHFAKSELKLPVLKYCIIHAIKTGQQDSYERLTEINLSSTEKANLINFLGDLLNREIGSMNGNEMLIQYFTQDFSKKMFDYFFGIELIDDDYKKTLNTLLKFELSNRKKVLIYTSLAIIAIINLHMDEAEGYIKKLRTFSHADFNSFAVNPLACLETLYYYLKYGVVKKEALTQLTRLTFHPPDDEYNLTNCASNDMLYLLGLGTLFITDNPKKILRYASIIKKHYKSDDLILKTSHYGFFINLMSADAHFKLGETNKVAEIYYAISYAYKKNENLLTPFMQTVFHCLRIKLVIDTPREDAVLHEIKCIDAVVEKNGSKLNKLYTLSLLLQNERFMAAHPNFKKQVSYDYMKLVTGNGLNTETFLKQKVTI